MNMPCESGPSNGVFSRSVYQRDAARIGCYSGVFELRAYYGDIMSVVINAECALSKLGSVDPKTTNVPV